VTTIGSTTSAAAAPILADDTGLGIERTRSLLIFTVISQTRSEPRKLAFYEVL
jgi:hypothetical protein